MRRRPEKSEALTAATDRASSEVTQDVNQGFNMVDSTQVAANRAITVPFHGADLYVVEHNGQPYTPMKPIVEGMGIDWKGQHAKLAANEARWGMEEISIPTAGGVQVMACIALRKLFGWLAGIHVGKIKAEIRPAVLTYQNECDDVLWQYWNEGIAVNPRATYSVNPGDVLTKEEADTLRQMVEGMAKKLTSDAKVQGKFIMQAWSKLKAHFHVGYREIPRHELTEAISIVNRHTVEWEVVDEAPETAPISDVERIREAFALATEVGAIAQRTVFEAVLESRSASMTDRWMFCMGHPNRDGVAAPWAKPIKGDAMVVSLKDLPSRLLAPNGMMPTNQELADLAAACNQRLAKRMEYEARKAAAA